MVYLVSSDDEHEPAHDGAPQLPSPSRTTRPLPMLSKLSDPGCSRAIIFSSALGCYPIVSAIAAHLDLNSLHHLALTCRLFRESMLQFRSQLVKQTLRCVNDHVGMGPRLAQCITDSAQHLKQQSGAPAGRSTLTSGRIGLCARDMVGDCRKCGLVVCRNCTVKPQPPGALKGRHRRLCKTCIKAPLLCHTAGDHAPSPSVAGNGSNDGGIDDVALHAFSREPCTCAEIMYICTSCGCALRSADTTYIRGWTWRTRYSTYLGGLGTGIGEGNEGVECGKGSGCLAAKEVEKEVDCDAEELAIIQREEQHVEGAGRVWSGTSYLTQEIEGIGGVVKRKLKKRVRVGAVVKEYEDERDDGKYLAREQQGLNRSWCAWCSRVIPGQKDDLSAGNDLARKLTSGAASSSSSVDA